MSCAQLPGKVEEAELTNSDIKQGSDSDWHVRSYKSCRQRTTDAGKDKENCLSTSVFWELLPGLFCLGIVNPFLAQTPLESDYILWIPCHCAWRDNRLLADSSTCIEVWEFCSALNFHLSLAQMCVYWRPVFHCSTSRLFLPLVLMALAFSSSPASH